MEGVGRGDRSRSPPPRPPPGHGGSATPEQAPKQDEEPTPQEVLAQANALLAEWPPQSAEARRLLEQAAAKAPRCTEVLDALGALLCEEGEVDRAREVLTQSVAVAPEAGAEKHLYLAQMSSGEEALAHYRRGAQVLQAALSAATAEAPGPATSDTHASAPSSGAATLRGDAAAAATRRQLAKVHASVAELYMTDLCDLPEAEEHCEAALESGLEADASCPELLTTKATLRKVQGRLDEAREIALRCHSGVKEALISENMIDTEAAADEEAQDSSGASTAPDEEAVLSLCQTLIDLQQTAEARELLDVLLEQDEEDLRVWCLLGYSHIAEKDGETAQECAQHGLRLCKKLGADAGDWRPRFRELLAKARGLEARAAAAEE